MREVMTRTSWVLQGLVLGRATGATGVRELTEAVNAGRAERRAARAPARRDSAEPPDSLRSHGRPNGDGADNHDRGNSDVRDNMNSDDIDNKGIDNGGIRSSIRHSNMEHSIRSTHR